MNAYLRKVVPYLIICLLIGGGVFACIKVLPPGMGQEPTFPRIQSLPDSSELLFYQMANLFAVTFSGEIYEWEASEEICWAAYSWSEAHRAFSIWGQECQHGPESCDDRPDKSRALRMLSLDSTTTISEKMSCDWDEEEHQWSPDGTAIALPGTSKNTFPHRTTDIFLQGYSRSDARQLTHLQNGFVYSLTWSPDGTEIAFAYGPHTSDSMETLLYRVKREDGMLTELPIELTRLVLSLQWSPDASRLAFISDNGVGTSHSLWLINTDASDLHMLFEAPQGAGVTAFAWSPDGTQIAFISDHQGPCMRFIAAELERQEEYISCGKQIYVITVDTAKTTRLTDVISYDTIDRLFWIEMTDS